MASKAARIFGWLAGNREHGTSGTGHDCNLGVMNVRAVLPSYGHIIAAPIPWRMRAATSIGALEAKPQRNEEKVKVATALPNTRRVP
jgi:hypothetical protein